MGFYILDAWGRADIPQIFVGIVVLAVMGVGLYETFDVFRKGFLSMEQALNKVNSGKLRARYQASRAPFFVATLIPLALAGVIAYKQGSWNTARWLVICLASFLVQMNTNLANDYFDFLSGADAVNPSEAAGCFRMASSTLSAIRGAMILFYLIALLCGLWIVWVTQLWWLTILMSFSFLSSVFDTSSTSEIWLFRVRRTICGDKHGAGHGGRRRGCDTGHL